MRINVTQEDIDEGAPSNCLECPIALAIKRIFKDKEVRVFPSVVQIGRFVYLDEFKIEKSIQLPSEASRFILTFDRPDWSAMEAKPFSFELEGL